MLVEAARTEIERREENRLTVVVGWLRKLRRVTLKNPWRIARWIGEIDKLNQGACFAKAVVANTS